MDPIEIYLAYGTALAGCLDLPVSTQNMLYERLAGVTPEDLAASRQVIGLHILRALSVALLSHLVRLAKASSAGRT